MTLDNLVSRFREKKAVIFHCSLSQQRGPSAAMQYTRARKEYVAKERKAAAEQAAPAPAPAPPQDAEKKEQDTQEIYVLEGGFNKWQELYGEDDTLTEGFDRRIWRH